MQAAPSTPQRVATEPSPSRPAEPAAQPAAPPPSYLQRVFGRVRSKGEELLNETILNLRSTEPWERYRAPDLRLPATYPARVDTPATNVPRSVSGIAYTTNHDVFTDGDMAVANRPGVAVRTAELLRRPNWPEIIRNDLSVGTARPGDPLRIFVPGLNTDIATAEERLHISAEQTGTSLALMANGATIDLQPIHLTLPGGRVLDIPSRNREWLQAALQRIGVDFSGWDSWVRSQPKDAQGRIAFPAGSRNYFSAQDLRNAIVALYEVSSPNRRITDSVQRLLIAFINNDNAPPLELWGYSEGTMVLGRAFEDLEARYLAEGMRGVGPHERTRRLRELRNRFERRMNEVTVLCIGPAYGEFRTPVRRVDFYAAHQYDQVPRFAGSPRMSAIFRAADNVSAFHQNHDALIPFECPWDNFDSHNFFAAGGSALKLFFEMNNTTTIRGLYEAESNGRLRSPTLEQVNARIRRDGAERYLWNTGLPGMRR